MRHYEKIGLCLIALLVSIYLQQDLIANFTRAKPDRVAAPIQSNRTLQGDTYHYYITMKKHRQRLLGTLSTKSHQEDSIDDVLFGAMTVASAIDLFATSLVSDSRVGVLLSLILQTAGLILAIALALRQSLRPEQRTFIGIFSLTFFFSMLLNEFMLCSFYNRWHFEYPLISNFPDILRIVNPQMGWAYALLLFTVFMQYLSQPSRARLAVLGVLSLGLGFFSISITGLFVATLGLMGLIETIKNKKLSRDVSFLFACTCLSLLGTYYQLHQFQLTSKGADVQTATFVGLQLRFHYLWFLGLLLPILICYRDRTRTYLSAILISSVCIGITCESIHLGTRLWVRGAVIFVWLIICVFLYKLVFRLIQWQLGKYSTSLSKGLQIPASIFIIMSSAWISYQALPSSNDSWSGYIEKDKWALLNWMNQNIQGHPIIASPDLEDSFLIPIYTPFQPLVELYDTSRLSMEQDISRYFFVLNKSNQLAKVISNILHYKKENYFDFIRSVAKLPSERIPYDFYQTSGFYTMLLYYPDTAKFNRLFDNKKQRVQFKEMLTHIQDGLAENQYLFDYLIIRNDLKPVAGHYKLIYQNKQYRLYRNTEA